MTILTRLLGTRTGDPYHEGIALYEQGRYAEAAARLRSAGSLDDSSPRGSLAAFYLRKCLLAEGRRLLAAGDASRAWDELRDAAQAWTDFPDLQFLSGASASLAGRWDLGLAAAREALRRNPDYCEARLLEAAALQALERDREAAESLNALLESGRRVSHRLVDELGRGGAYAAQDLPTRLPALLARTAAGDGLKERLAQAIAICQSGDWEDGLRRLAALAAEHPNFPDIRAKHAAALFQVGRLDEALAGVDAALAVNPEYRTAVSLRGLILADRGDLVAAREYLAGAVPHLRGAAGRYEEIFLTYLRAAVAFLVGEVRECRSLLEGWEDLPRHFARAALLLAACDDAEGFEERCAGRLEELASVWTADAELAFLLAAYLTRLGQLDRAEHVLVRWPAGATSEPDLRPMLLRGRVAIARGRAPDLPDDLAAQTPAGAVAPAAWRQLAAHRALVASDWLAARSMTMSLLDAGVADEETGQLHLRAALGATDGASPAQPPAIVPDSWVPALCWHWRRSGLGPQAEDLLTRRRSVRPDQPRWWWLGRDFWLGPVRRWIS